MLDAGGVSGLTQLRAATERKAKLAIQNLQETIRLRRHQPPDPWLRRTPYCSPNSRLGCIAATLP
jgi:hypothetical protein